MTKEQILENKFNQPETQDWYKPVISAMQEYSNKELTTEREKSAKLVDAVKSIALKMGHTWPKDELLKIIHEYMPTHLTDRQKMFALSNAMYQGGQKWEPKAGDYYTSSRPDFELYQIFSVENGKILTRYTNGDSSLSEWDEEGFLTEGFGPNRIHVPEWVFKL